MNQLKMVEDALVIYRLSRAPERRVFYIDVGNLPKAKAEQYLKEIMNRYRNKLVMPYAAGTMPINLSGSNIFAQSTGNVTFAGSTNATALFPKDTPAPFYDNPGYWVASSSVFSNPAVATRWNVDVTLTVSGTTAGRFGASMSIRNHAPTWAAGGPGCRGPVPPAGS